MDRISMPLYVLRMVLEPKGLYFERGLSCVNSDFLMRLWSFRCRFFFMVYFGVLLCLEAEFQVVTAPAVVSLRC